MPTVTLNYGQTVPGASLSGSVQKTPDFIIGGAQSVPGTTTKQELDLAWDYAQMQTLWLKSTAADLTLGFNDHDTPVNPISLKAGVPVMWAVNEGPANPFSVDVTKVFATNGTATTTSLEIYVGINP